MFRQNFEGAKHYCVNLRTHMLAVQKTRQALLPVPSRTRACSKGIPEAHPYTLPVDGMREPRSSGVRTGLHGALYVAPWAAAPLLSRHICLEVDMRPYNARPAMRGCVARFAFFLRLARTTQKAAATSALCVTLVGVWYTKRLDDSLGGRE